MLQTLRPFLLPLGLFFGLLLVGVVTLLMSGILRPSSDSLKSAVFLIGDFRHRDLGYFESGRIQTISYEHKNFFDIARQGSDTYAVLEDDDSSMDVFMVGSATPIQVTKDGKQKRDLSISSDGQYVAFSYVAAAATPADERRFDITRYTLAVFDTKNGSTKEFGNCAHPNFLDATRLFCVSAKGFEMLDIVSGERSMTSDSSSVNFVMEQPVMGAGGTFLMRESPLSDGRFGLFRITSGNPFGFEFKESLIPPEGTRADAAALNGDEAYLAVYDASGVQKLLRRGSDGTMVPILTIPAGSPKIMRIIF